MKIKAGWVLTIAVVGGAIGLSVAGSMQPPRPMTPDDEFAAILRDRDEGKLSSAESQRAEMAFLCDQTKNHGAGEWQVRGWIQQSLDAGMDDGGDTPEASRQFAIDSMMGSIELTCPWAD